LTEIDLSAHTPIDIHRWEEIPVPRLQLALKVPDVASAVDFYSKLFGTAPAKVHPGYANFAIADPPLKLVLIEGTGGPGSIDHLGVERDAAEAVVGARHRLEGEGLSPTTEEGVDCCYAVQDKAWVQGPDGTAWELYTVLADTETAPACCC
jgi:catechol 2,3-dioxygenase-like lactoylglutathione lyase family enzyme